MNARKNGGGVNPHINPVIGINADGRQELFAVGKTGYLYRNTQTAPNGGWSGWIDMGTSTTMAQNAIPTVGRNSDGRLEVFAVVGGGAHDFVAARRLFRGHVGRGAQQRAASRVGGVLLELSEAPHAGCTPTPHVPHSGAGAP